MSVSSITTFGSAAIASAPVNNTAAPRPDDKTDAPPSPAQQITEAAKQPGTGQQLDIKV